MRKPIVLALAGVFLAVVAGVAILVFVGNRWLKSSKATATMPWKTTVELLGAVKVDSPFPLVRKEAAIEPQQPQVFLEMISYEGSQMGNHVVVETFHLAPEAVVPLDQAVDFIDKILHSKVQGLAAGRRMERSIFGARAIEVEAGYEKMNQKMRMRSLYFMRSNIFYQVRLVNPASNPEGDLIWEKLKASVRLANGSEGGVKAQPQQAIQRASDGNALPPGMRRRSEPPAGEGAAPAGAR